MGNQVLTHTRAAKARAETQNLDAWKLGRVDKRMQKHPVRQRRISSRDFRPQGLGKDLQETASSPQASSWLEVHGKPTLQQFHPSSLALSLLPIQMPVAQSIPGVLTPIACEVFEHDFKSSLPWCPSKNKQSACCWRSEKFIKK